MPILFSEGFVRGYFLSDLKKAFGVFGDTANQATYAQKSFSAAYKKFAKYRRRQNFKYGKHTQRARRAR